VGAGVEGGYAVGGYYYSSYYGGDVYRVGVQRAYWKPARKQRGVTLRTLLPITSRRPLVQTRMKLLAMAAIGAAAALGYVAAAERLGAGRAAFADQPARAAAAPEEKTLTPDQAWQRLKAGNNRFADEKMEQPDLSAKRRRELAKGQKPFAVVLTCADSRLTPEFIFNQGLGDLFALRVAGNIVDQYELGSIEYAVEHLHVPLVVLLGHEKCGAVEAALGGAKSPGNLGKLLGEIDVGKGLPSGQEAALAVAVKNNARHQALLLTERSAVIKEHVEKKQVRIVYGVYQLANGKVDWLEEK
jgi:carbonic anhydrase